MRQLSRIVIVAAMLLFIPCALAADEKKDATGTWKWQAQGLGGQVEVVLKLKQDGEKLTGTISGVGGREDEVKDGLNKDGEVTFTVERELNGQKFVTKYTGTLTADGLKGKSETTFTREFDAKRAGG